jgi:hypothetical protein
VKNLVYIVTTTRCPFHKIDEVLKIQLDPAGKNLADDSLGTVLCPGAVKITKEGIENTFIYEVKPGKLEEALTEHGKNMIKYRNVEGYSFTFEIGSTMAEALDVIGVKPPQ